jgi:hypothetical protein
MGHPETPEHARRESAVVGRLRRVSVWAVLAGAVVFAVMFGLGAGIVAAGVFAAAYKGIEAAFGQRIKERFERQPDLRLAVASDGELVETMTSPIPSPWPIDAELIVAHELERLRDEAASFETRSRKGPTALLRTTDLFARRPSDEDYRHAREAFAEQLEEYERALRDWLTNYGAASDARTRTFEASLLVTSAGSGAYAEDVVLTIDLPDGVEVVDEWPTISPPPEPPAYVAPRTVSPLDIALSPYPRIDIAALSPLVPSIRRDLPFWDVRSDGRRVLRRLGNIHHDSTIELDKPLLLRVPAPGRHTLKWTLATKNGRRHRTGTLELIIAAVEPRPPVTRLHGIESYPDVPFVDDDGDTLRSARTSDPPTMPPPVSDTDEVLGRLRGAAAWNAWLALGLGDGAPNDTQDDRGLDIGGGDDAAGAGDAA